MPILFPRDLERLTAECAERFAERPTYAYVVLDILVLRLRWRLRWSDHANPASGLGKSLPAGPGMALRTEFRGTNEGARTGGSITHRRRLPSAVGGDDRAA